MSRIGLRLAYEGTRYSGWQVQPNRPTVQGALADAIRSIDPAADSPRGSSRTDAGVHAVGQVAAFDTAARLEPGEWLAAINARLPKDIAVLEAWRAADDFDPVTAATHKRYRYRIHDAAVRPVLDRRFVWRQPTRLDATAMLSAAGCLVGRHDFSSFEASPSQRLSKVRTIHSLTVTRRDSPEAAGGELHIEVEGDGFLYNMVRIIAGTLAMVGRGRRPLTWVGEVLEARHRPAAGPTAPPQGLVLLSIRLTDTSPRSQPVS